MDGLIILQIHTVYAIEASAIAEQAQKVIVANQVQDKIVIINDRVEVSPPTIDNVK